MVVTNQSALGRGLIDQATVDDIHRRLSSLVESEFGGIDQYFVCPHLPDAGYACRKPRPGLLLAARDRARVDLANAVLVGDQVFDVEAAWAAGCRAVLVLSGQSSAAPLDMQGKLEVAADLNAAVDLILEPAEA